jgi:hypothetical protein
MLSQHNLVCNLHLHFSCAFTTRGDPSSHLLFNIAQCLYLATPVMSQFCIQQLPHSLTLPGRQTAPAAMSLSLSLFLSLSLSVERPRSKWRERNEVVWQEGDLISPNSSLHRSGFYLFLLPARMAIGRFRRSRGCSTRFEQE